MLRKRWVLSIAAVCGLALVVGGTPAHATLQIQVYRNGTLLATFTDNVAGQDTNTDVGEISAVVTGLNALLTASGYKFTTLGASSNALNSLAENLGQLGQTAGLTRAGGTGGTLEIVASDTNYLGPPPGPGVLESSASLTYSSSETSGSITRTFDSFYNPSNTPFAEEVAAPQVTQSLLGVTSGSAGGGPGDTTSVGVEVTTPYGLTNHTTITLFTPGTLSVGGTTRLVAAIPEPAGVAALLSGLPVLGLVAWRRRRAR